MKNEPFGLNKPLCKPLTRTFKSFYIYLLRRTLKTTHDPFLLFGKSNMVSKMQKCSVKCTHNIYPDNKMALWITNKLTNNNDKQMKTITRENHKRKK